MRFDIITIFPEIFSSYFNTSVLKRARERGLISIHAHSLRDWAVNKYGQIDERPYGGGAGMVLMAEPILKAVDKVLKIKISGKNKRMPKTKIILFSAKGKQFSQRTAYDWAKNYGRLIFISGRYEGIDERVKTVLKAEEISIGPYVLTDGDVASMAVISSVARLIPGVIRTESLEEESHWNLLLKKEKELPEGTGLEYPHYTRPEVLQYKGKRFRVPKVLLSGNHKKIVQWRKERQRK